MKRSFPLEASDFADSDDYEAAVGYEISRVQEIYVWRAIRLAAHIGEYMSAYSESFTEPDLWTKLRRGEIQGVAGDIIQTIDQDAFVEMIAAANIHSLRRWGPADETILFLPSNGSLVSVPGILQIDEVDDVDDWLELLGDPPDNMNLNTVFYLAHAAARENAMQISASPIETLSNSRIEQFWETLKRIQTKVEANQESLEDLRVATNAEIAQLERIVAYMSSTDRVSCESSLKEGFEDVWHQLCNEARSHLIAVEQIYRVFGLASHGLAVHGLAAAFEVQIRQQLMPSLFEHLRSLGIKRLYPPPEWKIPLQKPLYDGSAKPEKLTLGEIQMLLRHPDTAIDKHLVF